MQTLPIYAVAAPWLLLSLSFQCDAAPRPARLEAGDALPDTAVLECRSYVDDGLLRVPEAPPTLWIEYSKEKNWVRVTMGRTVYEATAPLYDAGPKAWGADLERLGFSINVVAGQLRGHTFFKLAPDQLVWRGYCEVVRFLPSSEHVDTTY